MAVSSLSDFLEGWRNRNGWATRWYATPLSLEVTVEESPLSRRTPLSIGTLDMGDAMNATPLSLEDAVEEAPLSWGTPLSVGSRDLDVEVTPSSSEERKTDEQKECHGIEMRLNRSWKIQGRWNYRWIWFVEKRRRDGPDKISSEADWTWIIMSRGGVKLSGKSRIVGVVTIMRQEEKCRK